MPDGSYLEKVQRSRDARYWHRSAMSALLVFGMAHLFSGVTIFFTYNLRDLPAFAKFGPLLLGIATTFAAALSVGLKKESGQAMLIATSILTGVLLAVIGEDSQTGIDMWKLFAQWTVLSLPFALMSRSAPHWFLWIIICLTACSYYAEQVLVAQRDQRAVAVGVLSTVFLALREVLVRTGSDWLNSSWFRRALVVISMSALFFPAATYALYQGGTFLGFVAFALVSIVLTVSYLKLLPDFSIIAIVTAFCILVTMSVGARLIAEVVGLNSLGSIAICLLLLGVWCVTTTTLASRFLRYVRQQIEVNTTGE